MVKFECDKGITSLETNGDVFELSADITFLIHLIHSKIASESLFAGMAFEQLVRSNMEVVFKPLPGDAERNARTKTAKDIEDADIAEIKGVTDYEE